MAHYGGTVSRGSMPICAESGFVAAPNNYLATTCITCRLRLSLPHNIVEANRDRITCRVGVHIEILLQITAVYE